MSHRKALLNNLSTELILHRRIITTLMKAKYARSFAERLITFARRGTVADRRHVMRFIHNKDALKLLFDDLGPHFKNRDGGYTRIIKIGFRRGDAAPLAILELVGFDDVAAVSTAKKKEGKSRLKKAQHAAEEEKEQQDQGRKKRTKAKTKTKTKPVKTAAPIEETEPVTDEVIETVEDEEVSPPDDENKEKDE
jgi:large subunit ribosomal protein L17